MSNLVKTVESMSSLEIAKLTGKRHADVLADCQVLIEFYGENLAADFSAARPCIESSTYKNRGKK